VQKLDLTEKQLGDSSPFSLAHFIMHMIAAPQAIAANTVTVSAHVDTLLTKLGSNEPPKKVLSLLIFMLYFDDPKRKIDYTVVPRHNDVSEEKRHWRG
jgi:hypothetical protein